MILNGKIQQGFIRHLRDETYKALITSKLGIFFKKKKIRYYQFYDYRIMHVLAGGTQYVSSIYYLSCFYLYTNWSCILAFSTDDDICSYYLDLHLFSFLEYLLRKSNDIGESIQLNYQKLI